MENLYHFISARPLKIRRSLPSKTLSNFCNILLQVPNVNTGLNCVIFMNSRWREVMMVVDLRHILRQDYAHLGAGSMT